MAAVSSGKRDRRTARRVGPAAAAVAVAVGLLTVATPAGATTSAATPSTGGAGYRHGVVSTLGSSAGTTGAAAQAGAVVAPHVLGANTPSSVLTYGGGVDGVGVVTGTPQVYLVFYGSQWGTPGTVTLDGRTYTSYSGDTKGMAQVEQAFFAGLGTGGETWSGVMTQYCEGIATGSTTCGQGTTHAGYSTHGVLAGVWEDAAAASPAGATAAQLAGVAESAALHFGNTTQASNRSDQYVIVSPPGTHPDGFNTASGNFCAWHDYTGDPSIGAVAQPAGTIAFTNMPYLPDMGTSCGRNFVNPGAAGLLDGVTIVGGHEYAETVTDQFPAGGWTTADGDEAADLCAWISTGTGASADLALATGTFAVQSIWADDGNGGAGACELSHAFVTGVANAVTVLNPGPQAPGRDTQVSVQVRAGDSAAGNPLTYSATGLPIGYSINPTTGRITGKSMRVVSAMVTVRATDLSGASGSASFTWTT